MISSVLFVCLGNICRSPAAEGVFRHRINGADLPVTADSAGTGAWHKGEPPDRRMIAAAAGRGLDISTQRARPVDIGDFYMFDLIVAMDQSNLADLNDMAPHDATARVELFLDYGSGGDVPDPYYGGPDGFERVLDLVTEAADGLVATIRSAGPR